MGSADALPPEHVLDAVLEHLTTSLGATRAMGKTMQRAESPCDVEAGLQHYETARAALVASKQALAEWLSEQV